MSFWGSVGSFFKNAGEGVVVGATVAATAVSGYFTGGATVGVGALGTAAEIKSFWGGSTKKTTSTSDSLPAASESFWTKYKGIILCSGVGIIIFWLLLKRR